MDLLNCNWDTAKFLFFSGNVFDSVIYYSHLLPLVASLLVGFFVYFSNRKNAINKIILFLTVSFSLWVCFDLILWASEKIDYIMFFWSAMAPLELLIYYFAFYSVYLFINNKKVSVIKNLFFLILFVPIIFLLHTKLNLESFDYTNCDRGAFEGLLWKYVYVVEIVILIWTIVESIISYIKNSNRQFKKQIIYFTLGIVLFLLIFSLGNFTLVYDLGWKYEQYKLFGMPIFLGFVSYLIVRFKAFDIKLIGAQALVYSLIILIGSQFFFIQNRTNQILTGVTLVLAVGFGIFLIRSVKEEVRRKEELQHMTEQLAVANDELRKLDNAKSEFISIASHQLRTPLTSIKGYVSLVLEGTYGEIAPYLADPLSKIYASNERLIQLVEDLLNVSRIESGRMEFMFGKFKVESAIKDLYDTFSVIARGKGLYLHLDLPQNPLPEIEADGSKTREVFSNLIDNALKYTKRGGVTVKAEFLNNQTWNVTHLGGKAETMNGDIVKISISDTGMGVPDTELPYLFSKFSRGKDTSRLHVTGTGLGLYVGKNIIEAQHGRIYVESEGSGKGSKFIVELPVEQPKG